MTLRRAHAPMQFMAFATLIFVATSFKAQSANADATKPQASATVRAGAKSFTFPAPTSELVEAGSDYRVLFETFAPATNRLVAAYVRPDDFELIHTGKVKTLPMYALVEVPRVAEFTDVSVDIFKTVTDAMAKGLSSANSGTELKEQEEVLNRRLKQLNAKTGEIAFDQPVQLGTLFSTSDSSGFGMIMPVSANGTTMKMATGILAVRVRNRVVFGYLYRIYEDENTVTWMRKTLKDWSDLIQDANK